MQGALGLILRQLALVGQSKLKFQNSKFAAQDDMVEEGLKFGTDIQCKTIILTYLKVWRF